MSLRKFKFFIKNFQLIFTINYVNNNSFFIYFLIGIKNFYFKHVKKNTNWKIDVFK